MRPLALGVIALVSTAALSACAGTSPTANTPAGSSAAPAATATTGSAEPAPTAATPTATGAAEPTATAATRSPGTRPTKTATTGTKPPASDLSQLEDLGVDLRKGVLIDVADDGQDRYLQVGKNGVDFTGTTRTDSTMMSLKAAPSSKKNRVLIQPPFWNEDLGPGYCVADTPGAPLELETCDPARRAAQIWEARPAGDSGQFELHGIHGVLRVDNGKITTGGTGRTGLQTIPYAD